MRRRAFTLIELTVVGTLLLTLIGLAFVGYKAVESRTTANRAKVELTQMAASMQGWYNARGWYPTDTDSLTRMEPDIKTTTGTLTKKGVVSIATTNLNGVDVLGLAEIDESSQCLLLRVTPDRSPTRASKILQSSAGCSGEAALAVTGTEW